MKDNEKKMILILIIVSIVIIGFIYLLTRPKTEEKKKENVVEEEFVQVLNDGTKLNISNKLKEEKYLDGLKIGNIELTEKNGQTRILADITNETTKDVTEAFYVDIILYDEDGNEIATVIGMVVPIKVGETKKLSAGTTEYYANAYDFKVVKK